MFSYKPIKRIEFRKWVCVLYEDPEDKTRFVICKYTGARRIHPVLISMLDLERKDVNYLLDTYPIPTELAKAIVEVYKETEK